MRVNELITESKSHPVIVVDVQPAYASFSPKICDKIIQFVCSQTGSVLMYVNAEQDGLTDDSIPTIKEYWEESFYDSEIDWSRFTIIDKGYGYFRSFMDQGVSDHLIIKLIRTLYSRKLNDSRELNESELQEIFNSEYEDWMLDEPFIINWISVSQLKQFAGAYIVGGGRNECLREVELLMNAFNIKYKRIDKLVY